MYSSTEVYYWYGSSLAANRATGHDADGWNRTGLTMSEQLEWTEGIQLRASRDNTLYVIHERYDGKWDVAVYAMFTDDPDATEQWLGDYSLETVADAKELAQALADQRRRTEATREHQLSHSGAPHSEEDRP